MWNRHKLKKDKENKISKKNLVSKCNSRQLYFGTLVLDIYSRQFI